MNAKPTRLNLVSLEDRATPATFNVTTLADNGSNTSPTVGSFRAAIINANATPGVDKIQFTVGGTIALPAVLPNITDAVQIVGYSDPLIDIFGAQTYLNGAGAGAGANGLNFVNHTGSTVSGLGIGNFSGAGIRISGGGSHTLNLCFLGTNEGATQARPNGVGLLIENASVANAIGGSTPAQHNWISGNTGPGIRINNSYATLINGNRIGTDGNGTAAIANQGGGIHLLNGATGNTIGGVVSGFGNIISGNGTGGVILEGAQTSSNIIVGNRIGLDFSGAALGNAGPGIKAFNAAGSTPPGGIVAGAENVLRANTIARNTGAGVAVLDTARLVRIDANSIRDNGGLGIQVDATANAGLAAPTITSVKTVTNGQSVSGTFTGQPNTKYVVTIYTNAAADPSGFGEGQYHIGPAPITTNATGQGTFQFLMLTGTGGTFVSATVTHDSLGDTSAFSNAFARPDTLIPSDVFAVGAGAGGEPTVLLTDPDGTPLRTITPFPTSFTGGVRVAMGDLTNDGIPDLAVGTGVGIQAEVKVINSATQQTLFTINPFGDFNRGVFVAMGDVNADGYADLIISPDEGGGPRLRVFNGKTFTQIDDFFGIDDVNFRGGARAAVGDMNNDGVGDLAVSAGFGGGPRIAVFHGVHLGQTTRPKLFGDFFAFEPTLRNGAFVALQDVNGDGFADLVNAAGPGGAPRVRILNGKTLVQSNGQTLSSIADFFAGNVNNRAGVRVMSRDVNANGKAEVITAQADGSTITIYTGTDLTNNVTNNGTSYNLLASRSGGMFVG